MQIPSGSTAGFGDVFTTRHHASVNSVAALDTTAGLAAALETIGHDKRL
jgi:hypothetical protein